MTCQLPALFADTPTRHTNPFATCWTRPGAIPFRFSPGQSAEDLVAKLAALNWRGAIVGPHGSGKSTLLESIKPALVAAGRSICSVSLHDSRRRRRTGWEGEAPAVPRKLTGSAGPSASLPGSFLLVIDGYEQLGWLERLRVLCRCRRSGAGLLVTSHMPIHVPTLIRLSPDRGLVEQLVDDLCTKVSSTITRADIVASHACHGSNVREILFDLYDRHEQRRRGLN